jgi:hypothetical protein
VRKEKGMVDLESDAKTSTARGENKETKKEFQVS